MANDSNIVIKKVDKGSCVVVLDQNDYIAETVKQFSYEVIYKDINFKGKILQELTDNSNKLFKILKLKGVLLKKSLSILLLNLRQQT